MSQQASGKTPGSGSHLGQMNDRPSLGQIINTAWYARAVHTAVELNIAGLLKEKSCQVAEMARLTKTHETSLYRLLRALASISIFKEIEPGRFINTDQSRLLLADHPHSFYHMARFLGADWNWQTWGAMRYSIETGKPAFDYVYGMDIWQYFATKDPRGEEIFDAAMTAYSMVTAGPLAAAYDFSVFERLADVGGGEGFLLKTILQAYPSLKGLLIDRPQVIRLAKESLKGTEVETRCTFSASDIFQRIPAGADAYLLKNIIHDWNDTQAIQILTNCWQVMKAGGKLLLAEIVLQSDNTDPLGKFMDLQMLLKMQGGKERTEGEYRELLRNAGFFLTRIIPVNAQISLIEGERLE